MAIIGNCRLCQAVSVELRASHIIPEFFYKRIYTNKHKFTAINIDDSEKLVVEQKGYREYLLCQSCETKLSVWENELSKFMSDLITGSSKNFQLQVVDDVVFISGLNYDFIKKAIISIFWRMSITSNNFFEKYKLGKYEEKLRLIIDNNLKIDECDYPIIISKGLLNHKFQSGILFTSGFGRYANKYSMQAIVMNGMVFDIFLIEKKSVPMEIKTFSLKDNGNLVMVSRDYSEMGIDVYSFANRMRKNDIAEFYKKHH